MRRLHQDSGAVAGARIGADRATMLKVEQNRQRVFDDLVGLASLDVGNKSDAAGILFQRRIEQAEARRGHCPRAPRGTPKRAVSRVRRTTARTEWHFILRRGGQLILEAT